MNYDNEKKDVLDFFDNYIMKYLITDLEKLDSIQADANGIFGCSVPQALSTFAAIDLFGYFLDIQDVGTNIVNMRLKPFLRNESLFPSIATVTDIEKFIDSFKDDIRSVVTHRFFLMKYDIGKLSDNSLFLTDGSRRIFNVSYFTKIIIEAIKSIYEKIKGDIFIAAGDTNKEDTMKRFCERLGLLKKYQSPSYSTAALEIYPEIATTTTQTTQC